MGGKKGIASAKEKEAEKNNQKAAKAAKDKEDAEWTAAGDGDRGKAAKKKAEQEAAKQEAAAKKAEAKRLAEEEEAAMSKPKGGKGDKTIGGAQKLTKYQMDQQRAIDEEIRQKETEERKLQAMREVGEEAYAAMVETSNTNRADDAVVDARNVSEALAGLGVSDGAEKKSMKASWKEFEERTTKELKMEKPGLKMSQYRDMCWKMWQKSPENPAVQAAK